jgi:3-oxoacyl-[acyl-carrier protein] reductase
VNKIDLSGQTAVVTGGARGIGYACAERILISGATVVIWDQDRATLAEARDRLSALGTVYVYGVDITEENSVTDAASAAVAAMGKVDILVNNAGITGPNKKTWDYEPAEWRKIIDIDLTGAYLCARSLIPDMMARRYGRIVNIASVAGKEGNPNASAYSAAKAGLIGLTKSLGKELAESGIIVNCVTSPQCRLGWAPTPFSSIMRPAAKRSMR